MITIPNTDLLVHPLCLGTNVFGWSADEAQSHSVLDAYAANEGNFLDTADVYSQWKPGNVGGESETIIGNWLAKRKPQNMVIATKVSMLNTRPGLSAKNIKAACDDSLRRLKRDHIDIYYSHRDETETPIEETLSAYADLIAAGKVRYIAASQYTGARLQTALDISVANGLPSYVALQDNYNLITRQPFEEDQQPVLAANNLSAIPFYGLARGFLSGKYRPGLKVESVRAEGVAEYFNDQNWAVLEMLTEIADSHGSSVSAVSLAWLRANPQVSTPIASARTVEQLLEIVQVIELSANELASLNSFSA
jgi:aryl-alcohol dehydrogenase-like predicted oxidoreductase